MTPFKALITFMIVAVFTSMSIVFAQGGDAPQAAPADADLPLADLVYTADFASEPNWLKGVYDDNTLQWEPTTDGFSVISQAPDGPARFAPGSGFLAENFYVELGFTLVTCDNDESAMLFNVRSDPRADTPTNADSYVFVIQCDGTYRARTVNNGRSGVIDLEGNLPDAPATGTTNFLGVLLDGRQITWYLNGELISTFEASANPRTGQFALGAQLGLEVIYNSLRVWRLEGSELISGTSPVAGEEPSSDDPLITGIQGRNIVVEDFTKPIPELIRGWASDVVGYRIQNTVAIGTKEPIATRFLAEAPDASIYKLYVVNVFFQVRQCPADSAFGLALGTSETDFYSLTLGCDGQVIGRSYTDNVPGDPLFTAQTDAPETYVGTHDLSLVVQGDTLYAYLDNSLLGSFSAPGASQSQMGLVWSGKGDETIEVTIGGFTAIELLPR